MEKTANQPFGAMVERIAPYDTGNARRSLQKGEKLADRINDKLADIGKRPKLVRSFFKHPSVAYITDYE